MFAARFCRFLIFGAALVAAVVAAPSATAQHDVLAPVVSPTSVIFSNSGNLVVAESGFGTNVGRISLVARSSGVVRSLLSGLPAGIPATGAPSGPHDIILKGRTLIILIGEGDVVKRGAAPGQDAPNPVGPSSPIMSSVVVATFDRPLDAIVEGLTLTVAQHGQLADGHDVELSNASGEHATLRLVADVRDLIQDPRTIVRKANPFGMALTGGLTVRDLRDLNVQRYLDELDHGATEAEVLASADRYAWNNLDSPLGKRLAERTTIWIADAGSNRIRSAPVASGKLVSTTVFGELPNPLFPGAGRPTVEVVSNRVRHGAGGDLLVTLFTGNPFVPGRSEVHSYNSADGTSQALITGLSCAMDVQVDGSTYYVLEHSSNLLGGEHGRILRFTSPAGPPTVLADDLEGPTSMLLDPATGSIFVTEYNTDRLIEVTP